MVGYTIKDTTYGKNIFRVILHEDWDEGIERACMEVLDINRQLDGCGGEYTIQEDGTALVAFFSE